MEMRRCKVDEILSLRHDVLRAEKPFETARFQGDDESSSRHYALFEGGSARVCLSLLQRNLSIIDDSTEIAADNLCVRRHQLSEISEAAHSEMAAGTLNAWQLRGMATATEVQGRGLGTILIQYALNDASSIGYSSYFWCNARLKAVPFYEKNGWKCISEEFDVPGIGPHFRMITRFVNR
ncbi:MAG: GNAT family N-acetyltransferase [Bacteroidetes bacterium]|nr:GNAT family N-acetyltransferase [Bacteroidota bacterium]